MSRAAPTSEPGPGAVTVLITRRVKPGHGPAFESAMAGLIEAAAGFAGHLGGHVVRPGEDAADEPDVDSAADAQVYHVIFAFDSEAHLRAWQRSEARARGLAAVAPHTEGRSLTREVGGLALWFAERSAPRAGPPRWKVAIVTWLGIFPTVLLLFVTVAPLLAGWPLVPRTLLLTALVVLIMTWIVAPPLTRWLRPWLQAPARPA